MDGDTANWCPTKLEKGTYISGSGNWKYCDAGCPIHSDAPSPLPCEFIYNNSLEEP